MGFFLAGDCFARADAECIIRVGLVFGSIDAASRSAALHVRVARVLGFRLFGLGLRV